MKKLCGIIGILQLVGVFIICFTPSSHAQRAVALLKLPAAPVELQQVELSAEEAELIPEGLRATPLFAAEVLPFSGNFYSLQHTNYPPFPGNLHGLPCWPLGDGVFLMNDVTFDYEALAQAAEEEETEAGGKDGKGIGDFTGKKKRNLGGGMMPMSLTYGSNDLWLEITGVTNSTACLTLHGTTPDVMYEILSKEDLLATNWQSEGTVLGAAEQDWTATTVPEGLRTNYLFFRARSWVDSDGSGLPDWWQLQYFGQTGIDPYGDPDNDGWNNLQEYQNGTHPQSFNTPPPPRITRATLNAAGTQVTLHWESGGGPVMGYAIESYDSWYGSFSNFVSATTRDFVANTIFPYTRTSLYDPGYTVRTYFTNGSFSVSQSARVGDFGPTLDVHMVRNPTEGVNVMIAAPPAEFSKVRLAWQTNWINNFAPYAFCDVYATNLVNGMATVSLNQLAGYGSGYIDTYAFDSSGNPGNNSIIYPSVDFGFANAAVHLKQNLKFLLRAATVYHAFNYDSAIRGPDSSGWEYIFARTASPADYEHSSFRFFDEDIYFHMGALRPVEENFLWRNFGFNAPNFGYTGAWFDFSFGVKTLASDSNNNPATTYAFSGSGTETPLPSVLTNYTWMYYHLLYADDPEYPLAVDDPNGVGDIGLETVATNRLHFPTGVKNLYGLSINAILFRNNSTGVLYPGDTSAGSLDGFKGYYQTAEPVLQTVDYYFASIASYITEYQYPLQPIPGSPDFTSAAASPLLIAGFGQSILIAGWAKQEIVNGYAGKYAYLEQYFDKAYTIGTNGVATTNSAGILSPYGEFFPTQPGPAALVTMPDIETGARGTGVVQVIKLQLDVNHDGVMDTRFAGPDNTSQGRPFSFWANNDCDWASFSGDPGEDKNLSVLYPNYADYRTTYIRSQRDLEDWARLWICGVPALTSNHGYAVTLSISAMSGNPAINLVNAIETNGGTLYLADNNVGAAQGAGYTYANLKYPTISPTAPLTLPVNLFTNAGNKYLLFEGAGTGSGELVLTIWQGTNVLAQTSAWLDLHDVKDFYERAVITNNMSGVKSNWTSGVQTVLAATASTVNNDTNLIVLVHGINVRPVDCSQQGDTVFKRLYWAGYQGKFAAVKWPCNLLTPIPSPLNINVFNLSELQGYKASTALTTYLNGLRSHFPNHRLNILAHSQGNSVVSEAIRNGLSFDTYILTQGAIPASAYDVDSPIDHAIADSDWGDNITPEWQPMGYHGVYTNSNFTGNIVNFYNANDPVLAIWITDQRLVKPSLNYSYNGTNSLYHFLLNEYTVTDAQESRSMVSRSRTLSIGQSPPESPHGVIQSGIDLHTHFGFDKSFPDDHSAQWTWPIQTTIGYYQQIRESIKP